MTQKQLSNLERSIKLEEIIGTKEYIEKYFPIVKVQSLSIEDEFLKYELDWLYNYYKEELIRVIKLRLPDFRAQRMDPSVYEGGNLGKTKGYIYYRAGNIPRNHFKIKWWQEAAYEFMPKKESALGTRDQRIAFLGVLIKDLIEKEHYTLKDAWEAVCVNSKDLGLFRNSKNAKFIGSNPTLGLTGSIKIGEWYDLGNTRKLMDNGLNEFWITECGFHNIGSLIDMFCVKDKNYNSNHVGWVVLNKL